MTKSNAVRQVDWPRQGARFSVVSFFLCATLNCVVNNLLFRNPQPDQPTLWVVINGLSALILMAGLLGGIFGLVAGIRRKSSDTVGIAIIGLVLLGGTLLLAVWLKWALRTAVNGGG